MNKKSLGVLLVIFLALCGLTFWLHWRTEPIQPQGPFPGDAVLSADINQVAAFTVSSASATQRIARRDGRWVVESRFGYPADFRRIVEQLRSLADMKVGQVVRAEESDLTEFGLGAEQATAIQLENAAGDKLAELRIGNPRQAQREGGMAGIPEGIYVRVDEGPVLIVDIPLSAMFGWTDSWLDREVVNVPAESITSVTVHTDAEVYTLRMPRSGEYEMEGLAPNEKIESYAAGRVARAVSPLTLLDVADPAETTNDLGFGETAPRVEYATRLGERYVVEIGAMRPQGGGRYVRLTAWYDPPAMPESFDGVEPGSEEFKKKVEEFEKECAEREKKIGELNALFQKWCYVIPDYLVGNLTVKRSEIVRTEERSEELATAEDVTEDAGDEMPAVPESESSVEEPFDTPSSESGEPGESAEASEESSVGSAAETSGEVPAAEP